MQHCSAPPPTLCRLPAEPSACPPPQPCRMPVLALPALYPPPPLSLQGTINSGIECLLLS